MFHCNSNVIVLTCTTGDYCPPTPDMNYGYLWPVYKDMNIYKVRLSDLSLERLTDEVGYDAESTISPDGKRVIFTSDRDGDLELYTMDLDGSNIQRITYTPGYDGGPYFSYDSSMICWRYVVRYPCVKLNATL